MCERKTHAQTETETSERTRRTERGDAIRRISRLLSFGVVVVVAPPSQPKP